MDSFVTGVRARAGVITENQMKNCIVENITMYKMKNMKMIPTFVKMIIYETLSMFQ